MDYYLDSVVDQYNLSESIQEKKTSHQQEKTRSSIILVENNYFYRDILIPINKWSDSKEDTDTLTHQIIILMGDVKS